MSDWVPDEQALRLPRGDAAAWDAFYTRSIGPLYGHVQSRLGSDRETTEEVVAAIFFEAARSAQRYDPKQAPPEAWLMGIARHRIARFLDQRRRERERSRPLQPGEGVAETLADPFEGDDPTIARDRVAEVVAELEAEERELLLAKYVDGLSAAELADRLGRTPTAVHSALQRARDKFRRLYDSRQRQDEHPAPLRSSPS
ncbi:MAG: RNA polymerase sigma factor [Planctomycetota bacterium]